MNKLETSDEIKSTLEHYPNAEIYIVSGEGEQGTVELFEGRRSVRAIQRRLSHERRQGRWAYATRAEGVHA